LLLKLKRLEAKPMIPVSKNITAIPAPLPVPTRWFKSRDKFEPPAINGSNTLSAR
jgi:hypothetical protein